MNTLASSRSRVVHRRLQENQWWALMSWEADAAHRNLSAAAYRRAADRRLQREGKQS